jgi:phenylacetic acid degradation operon negative regulatory protein
VTTSGSPAAAGVEETERPVSARSVIASVLLPLARPELSGRALVRCGELFGIAEGTSRVALSRMVSAGELSVDDGVYRLAGPLLDRRHRQEEGRRPQRRRWDGTWLVCIPLGRSRSAAERGALRTALRHRRMGELRDSVWARPDNLPAPGPVSASARAALEGCWWLSGLSHPGAGESREAGGPELVGQLWDLPGWTEEATRYAAALAATRPRLERGDTEALAPGFRVAAATVRHLTRDPLLPDELLPGDWSGDVLRSDYDAYERAYRELLRQYLAR